MDIATFEAPPLQQSAIRSAWATATLSSRLGVRCAHDEDGTGAALLAHESAVEAAKDDVRRSYSMKAHDNSSLTSRAESESQLFLVSQVYQVPRL